MTEKQIEAEAHAAHLEKRLELQRAICLLPAENKDILGRELEKTIEQMQDLAYSFPGYGGAGGG